MEIQEKQKDWITVYPMGGLGNQLFQIFTTIATAIKHNNDYVFYRQDILYVGTPRPTYWITLFKNILHKTSYSVTYNNVYHEVKEFTYTPIPQLKNATILYGYFQSYKYFENEINTILDLIDFNTIINDIKTTYSNYFQNPNTVSLHFRIGDYNSAIITPYQYYENALSLFDNKSTILYCCEKENNDIVNNHISNLKIKYPSMTFIKIADEIDDWKQMLIMSLCEHNIIPNSTFSWWSAYLNKNKNKIVTYPTPWLYGNGSFDLCNDLCPPSWKPVVFDKSIN
jgi:hypothetical protein